MNGCAVCGVLGTFFRRVGPQTVETASGIRLDLHLGTFNRHFSQQCAIEHSEFGPADLDDNGVAGVGDHLALERFRVDVEAPRRNLGLPVEDIELEGPDIARNVTGDQNGHLCADGLGIHWRLLDRKGTPARKGGCPLRGGWRDWRRIIVQPVR